MERRRLRAPTLQYLKAVGSSRNGGGGQASQASQGRGVPGLLPLTLPNPMTFVFESEFISRARTTTTYYALCLAI
jgi:hypothetical protein